MAVFEIVPNFSEGREPAFLTDAAETVATSGARLLHATSDAAHHRSVLTIAGDGAAIVRAAVELAGLAARRIDLRAHRGAHPRIGALDVLPFVALRDATLADAAALAHRAGEAIWQRWGIPSFYYGAAARNPGRRQLPAVRRGQFEGLDARFLDPQWQPDVGNVAKHETAGAVAIGARDVLIAFNVELDSDDGEAATAIARALRERDGGLNGLRKRWHFRMIRRPDAGIVQRHRRALARVVPYRRTRPPFGCPARYCRRPQRVDRLSSAPRSSKL